tara:strand:- start:100 stop:321 length:222 start_codon:yes stop_codon:yes gene_type:complete
MKPETYKLKRKALANHSRALGYYREFLTRAAEEICPKDKSRLNILLEMRETISNTEYTFSRLSQYHDMLKNHL